MAKIKKITPTKEYSEEEINTLGVELINWIIEKDENIFIDDFFLIKKMIPKKDITYLISTSCFFAEKVEQAEAIEITKLKKFGSADRLNSSIVKSILINKYNWL